MADDLRSNTLTLQRTRGQELLVLPGLRVRLRGPRREAETIPLTLEPLVFGTHRDCDVLLDDPHVSRTHCELSLTKDGVLLRDLQSKNGTHVAGLRIHELFLGLGIEVVLGEHRLVLEAGGEEKRTPLSASATFGSVTGMSLRMRALFAQLESVAATPIPVVLWGESGTGKELIARALHARSDRAEGPFVVFDCSAVSEELAASELFGHEAGAFTGARAQREGLLEAADGGTLFLDEVGELSPGIQASLLRVLEQKTIRRLGGSADIPSDMRLICATHRDLRAKMADGTFRKDLFFRLAGVELTVPPLRERKDDIPMLTERFLAESTPVRTLADLPPHTLALLCAHAWPGNVRELKNVVQRLALFPDSDAVPGSAPPALPEKPMGFLEARESVTLAFEKTFLLQALERHGGNISGAARELQVSRQFLHKMIARHGIKVRGG